MELDSGAQPSSVSILRQAVAIGRSVTRHLIGLMSPAAGLPAVQTFVKDLHTAIEVGFLNAAVQCVPAIVELATSRLLHGRLDIAGVDPIETHLVLGMPGQFHEHDRLPEGRDGSGGRSAAGSKTACRARQRELAPRVGWRLARGRN